MSAIESKAEVTRVAGDFSFWQILLQKSVETNREA
jgi:hypothetical protein